MTYTQVQRVIHYYIIIVFSWHQCWHCIIQWLPLTCNIWTLPLERVFPFCVILRVSIKPLILGNCCFSSICTAVKWVPQSHSPVKITRLWLWCKEILPIFTQKSLPYSMELSYSYPHVRSMLWGKLGGKLLWHEHNTKSGSNACYTRGYTQEHHPKKTYLATCFIAQPNLLDNAIQTLTLYCLVATRLGIAVIGIAVIGIAIVARSY